MDILSFTAHLKQIGIVKPHDNLPIIKNYNMKACL